MSKRTVRLLHAGTCLSSRTRHAELPPQRKPRRSLHLEALESRVLLSVAATTLAGPLNVAGTTWVYDGAVGATDGSVATATLTATGPTTFNGHSAFKVTQVGVFTRPATSDSPGVNNTATIVNYDAFTDAGAISYANFTTPSDGSTTEEDYSPFQLNLPATVDAGVVYDVSYRSTSTTTQADGTVLAPVSASIPATVELLSEQLQSVTVEAGTFMAYDLRGIVDGTTLDSYVVPGIGIIETFTPGTPNRVGIELRSFTSVDKPVFIQQPKDVAAGGKMPPVIVQIQDASGNLDASSTASVTLTLNKANGDPAAKLGGAVTVNAVGGVATFSDLSVDKGGSYTLTAAASGASATDTSSPFKITADHFVFTKQPKSTDAGTGIVFTVAAETPLNKIDTTFTGSVQIGFNTVSQGAGAKLGGVTTMTLSNGVATFGGANAPTLSAAGVYTLTAGDAAGTTTGTSTPITITGLHLAFTKQPPTGDIKAPLLFTVTVENAKNKLQKTFNGEVTVSLNVVSGGANATLTGDRTIPIVNGIATYTAADDDAVNVPGTFTLSARATADEVPSGVATPLAHRLDESFYQGLSKPFELDGFQLLYRRKLQSPVNANSPIEFQAELFDKKHKLVSTDDGNFVGVSDISEPGTGASNIDASQPFAVLQGGIATFGDENPLTIRTPSSFKIRIDEYDQVGFNGDLSKDSKVTTTNGALSSVITVLPLHLSFIHQPTLAIVNEPITFQVSVRDSHNKLVSTEDGEFIRIVHIVSLTGVVGMPLTDRAVIIQNGIADFTDDTDITIDLPGTYQLGVAEVRPTSDDPADDIILTYTEKFGTVPFPVTAAPAIAPQFHHRRS